MLVINKIKLNNKFVSILWFRYIFLIYNYLYFYIMDLRYIYKGMFKNIDNYFFNVKFLFSLKGLFQNKLFFKAFDNKFLILPSNNFYIWSEYLNNCNLKLQFISYKGYFLKTSYILNIKVLHLYYNMNYIIINRYYNYFYIIFFKLLNYIKIIIVIGLIQINNNQNESFVRQITNK